ncbi:MAG: DUF2232 domain-containing protein [Clostridia bacterium]
MEVEKIKKLNKIYLFFGCLIISIGLMLASYYLPMFGIVAAMLCSIPIVWLIIKRSIRQGLIAALFLVGFSLIMLPLEYSFGLLAQYFLLGVFLGIAWKRQIHTGIILFFAIVLASFTGIIYNVFLDINFDSSFFQVFQETARILQTDPQYAVSLVKAGLTNENIQLLLKQISDIYNKLLPSFFILSVSIVTILTYYLQKLVLRFCKVNIIDIPLWKWEFPWYGIFPAILVLGEYLLADYTKLTWLMNSALNGILILLPFYIAAGLSYYGYLWKLRPPSNFFKILLVFSCVFLLPTVVIILAFMGIADMTFDLKKRLKKAFEKLNNSGGKKNESNTK